MSKRAEIAKRRKLRRLGRGISLMQTCLAIDFGTSNSLVAGATSASPFAPLAIDPAHADPTIMRSVLYSPSRHEWQCGEEAISLYYEQGAEGRIFRSLKKFLPDRSFQGTQVHGIYYSLEDLLSRMLSKMRERAEAHLGQTLEQVVLGHPALFSPQIELHREALARLEKSARLAGFKDIHFCPEPVAAAHHFAQHLETAKTVLIADFGGGTSDFTVVRMRPEGFNESDVLALGGLSIAGDAFDGSIMENVVAPHFGSKIEYRVPFGSNVMSLPKALVRKMCSPADLLLLGKQDYVEFFRQLEQWSLGPEDALLLERLTILVEERQGYHLFQCIEEGKKALAQQDRGAIDYLYPGIDLHLALPAVDFIEFSRSLVQAILKSLDDTLAQAGLSPEAIDIVCCTGGTARLGTIQQALAQRFGLEKLEQHLPFHAVINGLARKAQQLLR